MERTGDLEGYNLRDALLLLGPTGSGKTPFGCYLAEHGLWGRECAHFDFGEQLRAVDTGGLCVSPAACEIVRRSLRTGALLEDNEFFVVIEILDAFLVRAELSDGAVVVLNGMPRHVGQAKHCAQMLDVGRVVVLECAPATVCARIASDSGGDRAGRLDDGLALVEKKLAIFAERTQPLVSFYRARGVPVTILTVGVNTQPVDLAGQMERNE